MNTIFTKNEEKTGLRWTWNMLPSNRQDATRIVVPVACNFTPLKDINGIATVNYKPVACPNCRSVLNPYCRVDYKSKTWVCNFCLQCHDLPRSYNEIKPNHRPAELMEKYTAVEYVMGKGANQPPFYLYVIDTCLGKDQLKDVKEHILQSLDLLPEDANVGLITFGTTVQLFELGYTDLSKAYVFRGDQAPTLQQFQDQIGIVSNFAQPQAMQNNVKKRFIVPLQEFEMNITDIIDEIATDPWPVKPNRRSRRCTGVALSVATALCETGFKNCGGHIMTFVGGPCTMGDGKIVGDDRKEIIRLHADIQNDNAKYFKNAVSFYHGLAERLVNNGHVCHMFSACLDQVGSMELKNCIERTGGVLIMSDSFANPVFEKSFQRFLERGEDREDGNTGMDLFLNGIMEIQTSPTVKISGALGPLASINQKNHFVSENEIGDGNTNAWKMNCLTPSTTYTVFFDINKQMNSLGTSNHAFFQFITSYRHHNGEMRCRVQTAGLQSVPPNAFPQLAKGFDQECAAVVLARLAVYKAQTEYLFDVLRWLDRSLIKLVRRFGEYQKDQPNSLSLSDRFQLVPQFMYHLRRGHFLRIFNNSPDETCYYRFYLNREGTDGCLKMIQPVVILYTFEEQPHPVNLDSKSLRKDGILLLDCFDTVLIYHGEKIAKWVESGYHKQPQYESLAQLLGYPEVEVKRILNTRYPYPQLIKCDEGSSQARIIYAKVNPSTTHKTYGGENELKILTDDSSLDFFVSHLKELVVANEKY